MLTLALAPVFGLDTLIQVVILLVVLGLVYWLLQQLPIAEPFQSIIKVVVILTVCLWLLRFAGLV